METQAGSEYLLDWFKDLNASRPNNGMSILRLPYTEIEAWSRLNRLAIEPWEVRALRAMDGAFVSAVLELEK